jgi:hypothetical protein
MKALDFAPSRLRGYATTRSSLRQESKIQNRESKIRCLLPRQPQHVKIDHQIDHFSVVIDTSIRRIHTIAIAGLKHRDVVIRRIGKMKIEPVAAISRIVRVTSVLLEEIPQEVVVQIIPGARCMKLGDEMVVEPAGLRVKSLAIPLHPTYAFPIMME